MLYTHLLYLLSLRFVFCAAECVLLLNKDQHDRIWALGLPSGSIVTFSPCRVRIYLAGISSSVEFVPYLKDVKRYPLAGGGYAVFPFKPLSVDMDFTGRIHLPSYNQQGLFDEDKFWQLYDPDASAFDMSSPSAYVFDMSSPSVDMEPQYEDLLLSKILEAVTGNKQDIPLVAKDFNTWLAANPGFLDPLPLKSEKNPVYIVEVKDDLKEIPEQFNFNKAPKIIPVVCGRDNILPYLSWSFFIEPSAVHDVEISVRGSVYVYKPTLVAVIYNRNDQEFKLMKVSEIGQNDRLKFVCLQREGDEHDNYEWDFKNISIVALVIVVIIGVSIGCYLVLFKRKE